MTVHMGNKTTREPQSVEELERAYGDVISSAQLPSYANCEEVPATFFEAYYSGCEVLKTKQDFFDLAFDHFQRTYIISLPSCSPRRMLYIPRSIHAIDRGETSASRETILANG